MVQDGLEVGQFGGPRKAQVQFPVGVEGQPAGQAHGGGFRRGDALGAQGAALHVQGHLAAGQVAGKGPGAGLAKLETLEITLEMGQMALPGEAGRGPGALALEIQVQVLDEVLLAVLRAPRTFTREVDPGGAREALGAGLERVHFEQAGWFAGQPGLGLQPAVLEGDPGLDALEAAAGQGQPALAEGEGPFGGLVGAQGRGQGAVDPGRHLALEGRARQPQQPGIGRA